MDKLQMSKVILIVEDDVMQMKLVSDLLIRAGYLTVQSIDGTDIIALVEMHRPDLIIMDLQLPKASGLDYTRLLKANDQSKDIPIIAMTGFPLYGGPSSITDAGCVECIAKPITPPTLYEAVNRYVI